MGRLVRILNRWQIRFGIRHSYLSLFKCLIGTLLACHWGACFWALAPHLSEGDGWMGRGDGYNVASESYPTMYMSALYWSVMTMTTIGYGDIPATNDVERIFAILFMTIGACLYAYIVGAICHIIEGMDVSTYEFRSNMDNLNQYMSEIGFPYQVKMRHYFLQNQDRFRYIHNANIIKYLSPGLRKYISSLLYRKWFNKCYFFQSGHKNKIEQAAWGTVIMDYFELESFPRQEAIIKSKERAEKMYVLKKGLIASKGIIYTSRNYIGEDFILNIFLDDPRRHYSAMSLSYVEVFTLTYENLVKALNKGEFPATRERIRRCSLKIALRRAFVEEARRRKKIKTQIKKELLSLTHRLRKRRKSLSQRSKEREQKNFIERIERENREKEKKRKRKKMNSAEPSICNLNYLNNKVFQLLSMLEAIESRNETQKSKRVPFSVSI